MLPDSEIQPKKAPQSSQPADQRAQPWKTFLSKDMFEKEETEDIHGGSMGKGGLVRLKVEPDSKGLGG